MDKQNSLFNNAAFFIVCMLLIVTQALTLSRGGCTGPGTFAAAYPVYQIPGNPILSVYAHNDYLQLVVDTGIFIIPLYCGYYLFYSNLGLQNLKVTFHPWMP